MERETVLIYEARAREWRERRAPTLEGTARFRAATAPRTPRVDLGCGPGWHTAALGEPAIALDAAAAMLGLVPDHAPRAWRVRADIEALPFRDSSLGGAWASKCHLHVPRARLPLALARLHWALRPGAPAYFVLPHGDAEFVRRDGDFPGRFFAEWRRPALVDVLTGAGFAPEEVLESPEWIRVWARRARTLPDTVCTGMRLLVCGLNPSLYAADRGVGYARATNRFWPAAAAAGLVTRDRDPLHALTAHGMGMTDLVKRATPSARQVTRDEYRSGAGRLERLVRSLRPLVVCFVGLGGWRAAVDRNAPAGEQPGGFGGAPAYVMPSTSGLNTHATTAELAAHLRAAAALAR